MPKTLRITLIISFLTLLISKNVHAGYELICQGDAQIGGQNPIFFNCNSRQEVVDILARAWQTIRKSSDPRARGAENICWEAYNKAKTIHDGALFLAASAGKATCNRGLLYAD